MERRKDTRRTNDATVLLLAERVTKLQQEFTKKFDNGITKKIEEIMDKLNRLPCEVHKVEVLSNKEKIKAIKDEDIDNLDKKINGFYLAFITLLGVMIGLYFKK